MLFPAQNKLPHICIQLKDTYFSSKLDMGAEVNMLLGFGCLPPRDPSPLRGTLGSSLRSPTEGEGNEGFPPPPEKDLETSALQ